MPHKSTCAILYQAFLLFTLVSVAQLTTTAPTEEDVRKKVDANVMYIIIAIVLLFVITITTVVIYSLWQKRYPPVKPRHAQQSSEDFSTIRPVDPPQSGSSSSPYDVAELNPPEELPTWWEIPQDQLIIHTNQILGSGQFGVIFLADVKRSRKVDICAVKTLKREATKAERRSLEIELRNMSSMDPHPNIVNLIGAQTRNGLYNVVVEYCENRDLYNYVKKHRSDLSWQGQKESGTTIEYITRLRIAFDIANGMNYLSTKGFIHRDLAARNVLLDSEVRAKVSDFGRSRDVSETFNTHESIFSRNEPVPTRWMPVETLCHQIFTTQSDVWSFGVLLWEIESGALRPYNDLDTYRQVVDKVVHQGYRLQQPAYCPDVIYQIMTECWKIDPEERPTFNQIAQNLGNLLKAHLPGTPHHSGPPVYSTLPK